MKNAFCVFVLLCLIYVSIVSSIQTPKSCADYRIAPMQHFVKEGLLGLWFAHQLYDYPGHECWVEKKKPRFDGNMNVTDTLYKPDGTPETDFLGVLTFDHPGEGIYVYHSVENPEFSGSEYIILKTNYWFYSIVCRCTDNIDGSIVEFYVSSRFPVVPHFIQKEINKVIEYHGFDSNPIRTMDIRSCPPALIGPFAHE